MFFLWNIFYVFYCSQVEIDKFASIIDKFISELKDEYQNKSEMSNHIHVSSNLLIKTAKNITVTTRGSHIPKKGIKNIVTQLN